METASEAVQQQQAINQRAVYYIIIIMGFLIHIFFRKFILLNFGGNLFSFVRLSPRKCAHSSECRRTHFEGRVTFNIERENGQRNYDDGHA